MMQLEAYERFQIREMQIDVIVMLDVGWAETTI